MCIPLLYQHMCIPLLYKHMCIPLLYKHMFWKILVKAYAIDISIGSFVKEAILLVYFNNSVRSLNQPVTRT